MNRLIAILFILALFSCSNNGEPELNPESQPEKHYSLVGEWEWINSSGGYGGDVYTPENTENTLSLIFIRNGGAIVLENSDTVLFADYLKGKGESILFNEEIDLLSFYCDSAFATQGGYFMITPDFNRFVIMTLTDTLNIWEADFADGFGHMFKRKQN